MSQIIERCRRVGWLGLWLLARYSMRLWLTASSGDVGAPRSNRVT